MHPTAPRLPWERKMSSQNQVGETSQPVAPAPKNGGQLKDRQEETLPPTRLPALHPKRKPQHRASWPNNTRKLSTRPSCRSGGPGPSWRTSGPSSNGTRPDPLPTKRIQSIMPWIVAKFIGLLISILAVSMGAPFWFDVLNKLVNIRLSGTRPEPSSDTSNAARPAQPATSPAKS